MIHDPELRRIVTEVTSGRRANPGRQRQNPTGGRDTASTLQLRIVEAGISHRLSEDDLIEAAREAGVPDEEFADWAEELASWL